MNLIIKIENPKEDRNTPDDIQMLKEILKRSGVTMRAEDSFGSKSVYRLRGREEKIWENRFMHVPYLKELGADITVKNQTATIVGPTKLKGSSVVATDLRAGAAMVAAGLLAEGKTTITNVEHILRGYENIIDKLTNVGAKITLKEI